MRDVHYSDYLQLDKVLNSQSRESEVQGNASHDEMLFIIIHQVYELWFKQILFELGSINEIFSKETLDDKKLGLVSSRLERSNKIMKILVDQVAVIETMTALDFLEFRDYLSPASGFQSLQFRLLETMLGIKDRSDIEKSFFNLRLNPHENKIFKMAVDQNSLPHNINGWLERMPFSQNKYFDFWEAYQAKINDVFKSDEIIIRENKTISPERVEEEVKRLYQSRDSFLMLFKNHQEGVFTSKAIINCLFISLYQDYPVLHLPFKIIHQIIDFDQLFTKWRQGHAIMAKRMLGSKIGTGGSAGHKYLNKTANRKSVFASLTNVSSYLIPRSQRPVLPNNLKHNLSFYYNVPTSI